MGRRPSLQQGMILSYLERTRLLRRRTDYEQTSASMVLSITTKVTPIRSMFHESVWRHCAGQHRSGVALVVWKRVPIVNQASKLAVHGGSSPTIDDFSLRAHLLPLERAIKFETRFPHQVWCLAPALPVGKINTNPGERIRTGGRRNDVTFIEMTSCKRRSTKEVSRSGVRSGAL